MNKKILALVLAAAMVASSSAAFAEVGGTITKEAIPVPGLDLEIKVQEQGVPAYVRHDGVVAEVKEDAILLNVGDEQPKPIEAKDDALLADVGDALPETATISEDTVIFTATGDIATLSDVKEGANVSVFVDGNAAVPLINPPQYPASYVVIGDEENFAGVNIDYYEESDSLGMYINGEKSLAINVDENSTIVPVDGTKIKIDSSDLAGKKLAVFYTMMTMSIPPQTYPEKIVVLGEKEADNEGENDDNTDTNHEDMFTKLIATATGKDYNESTLLTRGMIVATLGSLADAPADGTTDKFTDCDATAYYAPYVAWATDNGIVAGFGDGTFRPNDAITREQAAVIIKNYLAGVDAPAVEVTYADKAEISAWAYDSVEFCTALDILHGRDNGQFDPKANITCGEFYIMLVFMLTI